MAWIEQHPPARSWEELRDHLLEVASGDQLACRGQPKDYESGKVFSSIDRAFRRMGIAGPLAVAIERIAIQRFIQQAPNYLPIAEQSHILDGPSVLMLMRHYGGPTRLLDWTESLWIAAFTAASGEWDSPGAIWVFQRDQFDSSVGARYGTETPLATINAGIPGVAATLPAVTVLQLDRWVCRLFGTGPRIPRVIAQQGMFTIGSQLGIDHAAFIDEILPNTDPPHKRLIRIDADLKPRVLKELAKMGITASSLFPGVDGVGRSLDHFAHFAQLDQGVKDYAQGAGGNLFPREDT